MKLFIWVIIVSILTCVMLIVRNFKKNDGTKIVEVDKIIKNARIYTVDDSNPWSEAMAIRDGKIVYVGSADGLKNYRGHVEDMQGKFIMPGIVDSHLHLAWASESLTEEYPFFLLHSNKAENLDEIKKIIKDRPNLNRYKFVMFAASLNGEKLTRDELDKICYDKPLLIVEIEQHSRWMNTREMEAENIDEYMPDISDGLSYCERDENGRINGRIYEFCGMANLYTDFPKEVYENGYKVLTDEWKKWGVIAAFDAGQPSTDKSIDNFFTVLKNKDTHGEMPFYLEGCYYIYNPLQLENAIKKLKIYGEKYNSEHLCVRTMKIMMDGTNNGHTAAQFENYADVNSNGGTLIDVDTLSKFIVELNREGVDLHVHTIGDRAIATVLDAVENVQSKLGDDYKIKVTCAHVEIVRPQDFSRFAKLGINVNFTPSWFGGNCYESYDAMVNLLGKERASNTHPANRIWNTGATVSFSSDPISLLLLDFWNPYIGIETGTTRQTPGSNGRDAGPMCPNGEDRLSLEKMIKGYTINGAKQMRLDEKIGSLEIGKEASYIVFENSLFDIEASKLHEQLPESVYVRGKQL